MQPVREGIEAAEETPCYYIKEFDYNGHTYIYFSTLGTYVNPFSVVHSPDCKCQINEKHKQE